MGWTRLERSKWVERAGKLLQVSAAPEDKLYEKGRCERCSLRCRARELLSVGAGIIPRSRAAR